MKNQPARAARARQPLALLTMALAFLLIASACSGSSGEDTADDQGSRRFIAQDESGAFTEAGQLFGKDLRIDDCLSNATFAFGDSVSIVPCTDPHDGRVFDDFDLQAEFGEEWPGDDAVDEFSSRMCVASEAAEIGTIRYYIPTVAGWGGGHRTTSCISVGKNLPRDDSGRISNFGTTNTVSLYYGRLEVGDCFSPRNSDEVLGQDCDGPHDKVVYHQFALEGVDFPGAEAVAAQAQEGCLAAFGSTDSAAIAEAEVEWYQPVEAFWSIATDGKDVTCFHT